MSNEMKHYGILRKSGRYPWGSGNDPYGNSLAFYALVDEMKATGMPDTEIAKAIGLTVQEMTGDAKASFTTGDLRSTRTIAKEQIVLEETNRCVALRDKGVSVKQISEQTGIAEPTVRLRIKNSENIKESALRKTAEVIRKNVDEHQIVDVGKGTEFHIDTGKKMGISPERMNAALAVLRDEGYETYNLQVKNVGTNNFTNQRVIVPPGTGFGGARRMVDKIHTMGEFTEDNGQKFLGLHPPLSINPKRLKVNFAEDGGADADGVVYVRPGAKDLDMGKNTYAQVRIKVGDDHYIKGMAVLHPDLPDGVDLVFNTNKKRGTPILGDSDNTVLKRLKDDEDNPFGSQIKRQIVKIDKDGNEKVTSALNIVNEEGDWMDWRKSLPSQMLAKQPHSLIKSQLEVTREERRQRLDEINKITNPVVRKKELETFADKVDSDAVDLRAAAMPRQRTQVIIPLPKIAKHEIYAPNFDTGEKLVLIRYPHGGQFEIPEVTVNNNSRIAKKLLGNAVDAIGIHPAVAERLSGADFDGDTVIAIPNRQGKIKGSESMGRNAAKVYETELSNFDPKRKYGGYEEKNGKGNFKLMTNTGMEMGMITNLITDMSIQGASPNHIVRAVRHSMVVIDAEKHKLNYLQSAQDNGIQQLRALYQAGTTASGKPKVGGASTLLSRATAETRIPERKERSAAKGGRIDPETGRLMYEPTNRMKSKYDSKTGTYHPTEKVPYESHPKRLALTDDAHTLVHDPANPVERLYADHANEMKTLANQARLMSYHTTVPSANPKAKAVYKDEVATLKRDLDRAKAQKPLDRRADNLAGIVVKAKRKEDPSLAGDRERLKKVERQAKAGARARLGLTKPVIPITDRQWDAIQANAISPSKLREILEYADPKRITELATPRTNAVMTAPIAARAKAMLGAGATNGEVAAALGISVSTLTSATARGDV